MVDGEDKPTTTRKVSELGGCKEGKKTLIFSSPGGVYKKKKKFFFKRFSFFFISFVRFLCA